MPVGTPQPSYPAAVTHLDASSSSLLHQLVIELDAANYATDHAGADLRGLTHGSKGNTLDGHARHVDSDTDRRQQIVGASPHAARAVLLTGEVFLLENQNPLG